MERVTISSVKLFKLPLPVVVKCYHCNEDLESEGIGCSTCDAWVHKKCMYVNALSKKDINKVNWICDKCLDYLRVSLHEESSYKEKFEELKKSTESNSGELKRAWRLNSMKLWLS